MEKNDHVVLFFCNSCMMIQGLVPWHLHSLMDNSLKSTDADSLSLISTTGAHQIN